MSEAVARPIEPAPGRAPGPSPSPSPSPAADAPGGAVVLRLTEAAWGLVLLGLLGWLGWAAAVSRVDNYDSYDVICNARHLLGRTPEMIAHRPPLLAAMMIPSELARERWGLHPLDVRPYHAAMALIHAGYLLVCAWGLRRAARTLTGPGREARGSAAALIAFVAAVPSFLFFSYAPFLSHDLAPGAVLLAMLLLADRYAQRPTWGVWAAMVALGAAGPLIKQTYALFWLAIVAAYGVLAFVGSKPRGDAFRPWAGLLAGAAVSAAIVWLVIAWSLGAAFPETAWLLRPLEQVKRNLSFYRDPQSLFPAWLYARNAWAYGWVTIALLPPGLALACRGPSLLRAAGIVWLLCVAAMHAVSLRELRYLAYLAPLSALLLIPPLLVLFNGPRWRAGLALVLVGVGLALDAGQSLPESLKPGQAFYRRSELLDLLGPLFEGKDPPRRPLVINWPVLSLTPGPSPFAGDRYHRMFHFGHDHLRILLGYRREDIRAVPPDFDLRRIGVPPAGSAMVLSSAVLVNPRSWNPAPPVALTTLKQAACVAIELPLTYDAGRGWIDPEERPVQWELRSLSDGAGDAGAVGDRKALVLASPTLNQRLRRCVQPVLWIASTKRSLRALPDGTMEVQGVGTLPGPELREASLHGFEVRSELRYSR